MAIGPEDGYITGSIYGIGDCPMTGSLLSLLFSLLITPVHEDSLARAVEKDRADTEAWLKSSPTSYLATIHREDFGDRTTLTVGRAADNDIHLDDTTVALHHLRITVMGDSFRVEALDPGAMFVAGKDTLRSATLPPRGIGITRYTFRLSHQNFPAIIVYDAKSPRYSEYKGLSYFPYDPAFRYVLPLVKNPNAERDTVVILSTRGNRRKALKTGWFEFTVGGKKCRLEVTRLLEPGVGEDDYSMFFHDQTCGKESYPMGRYVGAEELPDGNFVVDFNYAYNPACAFSEHYNCPIPPRENHLNVRIRAGEKDAHYLAH
jgi:uncharacterized protein